VTVGAVRLVDGDAWPAWRDIRLRALRDSPDACGSTLQREEAFTEDDWRARLDGTGPAVLGYADDPHHAVTMGAGWPYEAGRLMIVAMWTDPAHRGRRLATRVLDLLVDWAGRHDRRPDLWVADDNPAAHRLYERYGFVANGDREPLRDGSALMKSRLVLRDD